MVNLFILFMIFSVSVLFIIDSFIIDSSKDEKIFTKITEELSLPKRFRKLLKIFIFIVIFIYVFVVVIRSLFHF